MRNDNSQSDQELLKKLRKKAELCRFCHSELKEEYTKCRNRKEFSIILLSSISVALIGLYYRGTLEYEWVLLLIFILPLIITIVQALDHTVFRWTDKMTRHESAVAIWGNWVREADFLEKSIRRHPDDSADEKMRNMQEKYNGCMSSTEQIPSNKFLCYKEKFKAYQLRARKIDEMSLDEIEKNEKK